MTKEYVIEAITKFADILVHFLKRTKVVNLYFLLPADWIKKKIAAKVNMCTIISRIPVISESYTYVAINVLF